MAAIQQLLLATAPQGGGIEMDYYLNFNAGTNATLMTAANVNASGFGDPIGTWTATPSGGEPENLHTYTETHSATFPFSVVVDGDSYDGSESGSKGLTFDFSAQPIVNDIFQLTFPADTVTNAVLIYLIQSNTVLDGGSPVSYNNDTFNIAGSNFTVPQLNHAFNGSSIFDTHSSGDNGSAVDYTQGDWVLVTVHHDATGQIGELYVQDPVTQEVLGSSQSEHTIASGSTAYIKLQDYLRPASGTGNIKVKNVAMKLVAPVTFPPYDITPYIPAPTAQDATQTDVDTVSFTWSQVCQIVDLERKVGAGLFSVLVSGYNNNGVGAYEDTDVTDGETYTYRVRHTINSQAGPWATTSPLTVDNGPFAAPTWTDATPGAGTDTAEAFPEFAIRQPVVCGTTGNCVKLRIWIFTQVNPTNLKCALYDSSLNLLGQGILIASNPAAGAYLEFTLDAPVAVTSSTTYNLEFIGANGFSPKWGYLASQPANSSFQDFATSFAAFPVNPSPSGSGLPRLYGAGMGVIP